MKTNTQTKRGHPPSLGIDIGRVIICPACSDGTQDTSFLGSTDADAMKTPPSRGAIEVIGQLVEKFEGRVWLVSKCGPRIEKRSRAWLRYQRFFAKTGLAADHLRFCKKRRDKVVHCRQLRLSHFIDDRVDVLRHMVGVTEHLYLFGHQKSDRVPNWVTHVDDWQAVANQLMASAEAI